MIDVLAEVGERWAMGVSLSSLATLAGWRGEYATAIGYDERTLAPRPVFRHRVAGASPSAAILRYPNESSITGPRPASHACISVTMASAMPSGVTAPMSMNSKVKSDGASETTACAN